MVMDARGRVESYSHRTRKKRPWDEDLEPPETVVPGVWHGGRLFLPPIDAVPYRRHSVSAATEVEGSSRMQYGLDMREDRGSLKRPKFEKHDNNSSTANRDLSSSKTIQAQSSAHSLYNGPRNQEVPSFRSPQSMEERGSKIHGPVDITSTRDDPNLCQRCKRLTIQHQDSDIFQSCAACHRDPEFALVTRSCNNELSKLQAKLLSVSSDVKISPADPQRNQASGQFETNSTDYPPIEQFGLKHTLNWILRRLHQINDLADNFVQHVPQENSQRRNRNNSNFGVHDVFIDSMKRTIDSESDDSSRPMSNSFDHLSDIRYHARRRSGAFGPGSSEDLRSPHDLLGEHSSLDASRRGSIMNPPPAPSRQLPSPPGRSLPSPTSLNFPSPSSGSHGSTSNSLNLPPPASLHQTSLNAYLPPIGSTPSPDALQAHSATLQHEVSVQKIALASLQGEHNKLLAAFSRSQTRASALEKKHQVSDAEIISLTEEKLRLQSQVTELEKDIEELARSRDEYRQAAVQGGAQYVEMIKKASRLEEMADEERKAWAKLKAEMEQRIESLMARADQKEGSNSSHATNAGHREPGGIHTPPSSIEGPTVLKLEAAADMIATTQPILADAELVEEIRRLRNRCAEAEDALRAIRNDSRHMEDIVEALGLAGKSIIARADMAVGAVLRTD